MRVRMYRIGRFTFWTGLMAAGWLMLVGCTGNKESYPETQTEGKTIFIELAGIDNNSGRFFTYVTSSGKNVNYFVYKDSSGRARAVLDACRTCYRWRKGYRLEGGHVVCVKCGMRFALDGLAEGTGSCVPIPLSSTLEGDTLAIPVTELEKGGEYF